MNFIKKILSKIPQNNGDWFRLCISFFLVGLLLFAIGLLIVPSKDDNVIVTISSIYMALSLFCFPYIDKSKMFNAISKFVLYYIYLVLTIAFFLVWISSVSQGNISIMFSIIISIMLIILINITLKPIFFVIKAVSQKINQIAQSNQDGHLTTIFKNTFANLSIITAFIISLLTIIQTVFNILKQLNIIQN